MNTDDDFDFTQPAKVTSDASSAPPVAAPPAQAAGPAAAPPSAPFKPAFSKYYDAKVAEQFFRESGQQDTFAAGTTLFVEGDKSGKQGLFGKRVVHRMYYITAGEVALTIGGRALDAVKSGEVFGEMAVISEIPGVATASARSATATAKSDVTAYSLDGAETQAGLAAKPEFALMLMSVMFDRLRFVSARLAMRKTPRPGGVAEATPTFTRESLKLIEDTLERATVLRFEQGAPIMREGDAGTSMYVVLSGRVGMSIKGAAVEVAGPGATFGEMSLVDQSPRAASANAESAVKLLAINRVGLIEMVKSQPAIGMTLMRSVADRLRNMNALLNS